MISPTIREAANLIDRNAKNFEIASLQAIRKEMKGMSRLPGRSIFSNQTINDDWAFHHGGRTELQFNIGFERSRELIRCGIAFSFELSQTLPKLQPLLPKVRLFNEFISQNVETFSDFRMWHYDSGVRSSTYSPSLIPEELVKIGVFVFVGSLQPASEFDPDQALCAFDRLLPLYKYTEGGGKVVAESNANTSLEQSFKPGFKRGKASTTASFSKDTISMNLRHGVIQEKLFSELTEEYGDSKVGGEIQVGESGWADLVLKHKGCFTLYEVKTSHSARICIREAMGQLLEYGYWPRATEPLELVVVGEPAFDSEAREYLGQLRSKFSIPIRYQQVVI